MKQKKSNSFKNKLFYLSPWILAVACTVLLLLLMLFALSNYKREKDLVVGSLVQKGMTVIRFVGSYARESFLQRMQYQANVDPWLSYFKEAMDQGVEQPGVDYILLLNSAGNILVSAGNIPEDFNLSTYSHLVQRLQARKSKKFISQILHSSGGRVKKIQIGSRLPGPRHMMVPRGEVRRMGRRFAMMNHRPLVQQEIDRLIRQNPVFIVQLDFDRFDSPLKRQLLQIMILVAVMLLVGGGGTISLLTLRGLKRSENRLGKARAFNDMLVSALPVGLIATDSSKNIQVFNKVAEKILDIPALEITGTNPIKKLPDEIAGLFGVRGTGYGFGEKEITLKKDQFSVQNILVTVIPVPGEIDRVAGEMVLLRDVTKLKALEKELRQNERMAALGKMAAGVAHELRNPLSSIKGLTVLLKSQFSDPKEYANTSDVLLKEVDRLNRSISELLDFAKPGSLKKEVVSLKDIIEKTISLISVDAHSYGVEIVFESDAGEPKVEVDIDKISQLFLNLFLNSIQAMESGGKLNIQLCQEAKWVKVVIRDSGSGIAPDLLDKIFDPYFTTKSEGTGLGLALSSKIIEEHGGQIKVSSKVDAGSVFEILLPKM